jgi:hypothetical protein
MSKSRIPSFSLLSSFSRALRQDSPVVRTRTAPFANLNRCSSRQSQSCQSSRVLSRNGYNSASGSKRAFSNSTVRSYKTVEEQRSRYRSGVCYSTTPFILTSIGTNCVVALLLYSRYPIPSLWRRPGGVLPVRESAHGAEARRRGHERHWEAKGWRGVRARGYGGETFYT